MSYCRHVRQSIEPGLTVLSRFTLALFLFVLLALPQVAQVAAADKALPGPRSGHCMVTWTNPSTNESWLYVVGGEGNSGFSTFSRTRLPLGSSRQLNEIDWEALNTTNFTVVNRGACVIAPDNKYLLVVGGKPLSNTPRPWSLGFKDQAGMQVYDLVSDKWIPPLTRRGGLGYSDNPIMDLEGHVTVSVPSTSWILVIGGDNHRNKPKKAQRFFFTLSTQSEELWVWTPRTPGDRPKAVWQPGAVVVDTKVYLFSGTLLNEDRTSRDINVYDTAVSDWMLEDSFQLSDGACYMCQTAVGVSTDERSIYVIPGVVSTEQRHPIQKVSLNAVGEIQDVSDVGDPNEPTRDAPLNGHFAYAQFQDVVIIYSGDTIYRFNMSTESWENLVSTESPVVDPSMQSDGSDDDSDNPGNSEPSAYMEGGKKASVWPIVVGSIIGALAIGLLVALLLYWRRKKRKEQLQYRDEPSSGRAASSGAKRSRDVALSRAISGGVNDDYSSEKSLPPDGDLNDVVFLSKLLRRLSFLDRRYGNSQRSSNVETPRSSQLSSNFSSHQSLEAPPDEDRTPPTNGVRHTSLLSAV